MAALGFTDGPFVQTLVSLGLQPPPQQQEQSSSSATRDDEVHEDSSKTNHFHGKSRVAIVF
jgi:hypothetical protein